jgi:hypothetical protein
MRVVRRKNSGALVDAAVENLRCGHFFKLPFDSDGRNYYRAAQGESIEECTFALEHDGRVVSVVECDNASKILGRFGFPIEICMDPALPHELRRQVLIGVGTELQRLAREHGVDKISIRSAASTDPGGMLIGHLLRHGANAALELRAIVDLSIEEPILLADLRKGHRQQVRWGNANLTWSFVDCSNPDLGRFESYRAFHAEIAGRVTRSAESWTTMYQAIAGGRGDLVLGYHDGKLVSGTLVLDGGDTAYYASGVYRREMFDKPLGHAAVFAAILRAKARGRAVFDVGELPDAAASGKEQAIGYFKQGFASRTEASVVLTWR